MGGDTVDVQVLPSPDASWKKTYMPKNGCISGGHFTVVRQGAGDAWSPLDDLSSADDKMEVRLEEDERRRREDKRRERTET